MPQRTSRRCVHAAEKMRNCSWNQACHHDPSTRDAKNSVRDDSVYGWIEAADQYRPVLRTLPAWFGRARILGLLLNAAFWVDRERIGATLDLESKPQGDCCNVCRDLAYTQDLGRLCHFIRPGSGHQHHSRTHELARRIFVCGCPFPLPGHFLF